MNDVLNSIMAGLSEAVEDAEGKGKKLPRRCVSIEPVKQYRPDEIKAIRHSTGFSQKNFAGVMGVSDKTVEAWESGTNHPSGAASRLLRLLELDSTVLDCFSNVKY